MEIHVIRHTPVAFDKNRCYGQLDVPLADSFERDAAEVKESINQHYDLVFCSSISRCLNLANALNLKNIRTDERLLELDFGQWEGKLWSEIDKKALDLWMNDFVNIAAGNGESFRQMFTRVSSFFQSLRGQNHDRVLIITHSGVIRCLWGYLLEIPLVQLFKIPIGYNEHFIFKLDKDAQRDSIIRLS